MRTVVEVPLLYRWKGGTETLHTLMRGIALHRFWPRIFELLGGSGRRARPLPNMGDEDSAPQVLQARRFQLSREFLRHTRDVEAMTYIISQLVEPKAAGIGHNNYRKNSKPPNSRGMRHFARF